MVQWVRGHISSVVFGFDAPRQWYKATLLFFDNYPVHVLRASALPPEVSSQTTS